MNFPSKNQLRMSQMVEVREDGDGPPVMEGHLAVFNDPTEIQSWDGPFTEMVAPGAFTKTLRENRDQVKALFQHGRDPQIGEKPLGKIVELREDDKGVFYRVELSDARFVREEVLPGLRDGLYGASFQFDVTKEETRDDGTRVLREVRLYEFGPVTFPAYKAATAGVRSMIDLENLDEEEQGDLLRLVRKAQGVEAAGGATAEDAETEPGETTPSYPKLAARRERLNDLKERK